MLSISLELDLDPTEAYRNRALQLALWHLIHQNELYLQHHPETPKIYKSGVKYAREPFGYESWPNIPVILRRGVGDCEDLAAWRVAELRQEGIPARPSWYFNDLKGPHGDYRLYHIRVWIPNVGPEDVSVNLGMNSFEDLYGKPNYDWIAKTYDDSSSQTHSLGGLARWIGSRLRSL